MVDAEEVKKKIIEFLNEKGPSLPMQISRAIGMNSIFASAFLSELFSKNQVLMTNMKVGGSKLYLLKGQENMLEEFYSHLHGKEQEAFLLLKGKGILVDEGQEPAIRVALRALKDFAIGFKKGDKIFWRYYLYKESENVLEKPIEKPIEVKKVVEVIEPEVKEEVSFKKEIVVPNVESVVSRPEKKIEEDEEPLLELTDARDGRGKVKEKSDFVLSVVEFLRMKGVEIIKEREFKKREYVAIVRINSELGKMNFLCMAKDKKSVTDNDLRLLFHEAQSLKLPALMIYPEKLNRKAEEYINENNSLVKVLKLG